MSSRAWALALVIGLSFEPGEVTAAGSEQDVEVCLLSSLAGDPWSSKISKGAAVQMRIKASKEARIAVVHVDAYQNDPRVVYPARADDLSSVAAEIPLYTPMLLPDGTAGKESLVVLLYPDPRSDADLQRVVERWMATCRTDSTQVGCVAAVHWAPSVRIESKGVEDAVQHCRMLRSPPLIDGTVVAVVELRHAP